VVVTVVQAKAVAPVELVVQVVVVALEVLKLVEQEPQIKDLLVVHQPQQAPILTIQVGAVVVHQK
jgi:hypothetical protein